MSHAHDWHVFICGSEELSAFHYCPACNVREGCAVPAGYRGVPMSEAPAYILPPDQGDQLSLWEQP